MALHSPSCWDCLTFQAVSSLLWESVHTIPSYPTLSLLSMQTQVRTRERPRHQSSLSSCHSGLCWGGFSRINSSSQLCRQVSGLGLVANKPFVDAGQRASCLQLCVPGLRIPSTANPQPRLLRKAPVQRSGTRGCWRNSGFRQQGKYPLSEQNEKRTSVVPWSWITGAVITAGAKYHREVSRIWGFPPWNSWVFSMSSEGWLFYFKTALEVPVAGV